MAALTNPAMNPYLTQLNPCVSDGVSNRSVETHTNDADAQIYDADTHTNDLRLQIGEREFQTSFERGSERCSRACTKTKKRRAYTTTHYLALAPLSALPSDVDQNTAKREYSASTSAVCARVFPLKCSHLMIRLPAEMLLGLPTKYES